MRSRRIFLLVFAAVLLAIVAALSTLAFLPAGQRFVAGEVQRLLNGLIAGRVEIERIAPTFGGVRIEGGRVFTPAGQEVLAWEGAEASGGLSPRLLRGIVRLEEAEIRGLRLLVEFDETGTSLAAAFAPREPSADDGEGGDFLVDVEELRLRDVAVIARQRGEETSFELREMHWDGSLRIEPRGLEARGQLQAEASAPFEAPLRFDVDLALVDDFQTVRVNRLAGKVRESSLRLRGAGNLDSLVGEVEELELRLAAEDAKEFVPSWQPGGALSLRGRGSSDGETIDGELIAEAAGAAEGASLEVKGTFGFREGDWQARVRANAVDPRAFDLRAPAGSATFEADVEGREWTTLGVELRQARLQFGGAEAGPVRASFDWEGRRLQLRHAEVALPGGRVAAGGWVDAAALDLRFDLTSRNLEALSRSVDAWLLLFGLQPSMPSLQGDLAASGRIRGSLAEPKVEARMRAERLRQGTLLLRSLRADVEIEGLPNTPIGRLRARASQTQLGDAPLGALRGQLRLQRRRWVGGLASEGRLGRIEARIDAIPAPGLSSLKFETLELSWPGVRWRLESPFELLLEDGFALRGLRLSAADGALLYVDGSLSSRGAVEANARIREVELSRLPPGVLPEGVAGRLAAELELRGTKDRPVGEAGLRLRGLRLRELDALDVDLIAAVDGEHLRAEANAIRGTARLSVEAESSWPPRGSAPLRLRAELRGFGLQPLSSLLDLPEGMTGFVGADLALEGTLDDPRGRLGLRARGLATARISPIGGEAELLLQDGGLVATATAEQLEGKVELELRSTFEPSRLLRKRDKLRALGAAPIEGRLRAQRLQLSGFAGHVDPLARGLVDLAADVGGTPLDPRGTLRLGLRDLWSGGYGPVDLDARVEAKEKEIAASLQSQLLGRRFVVAEGKIGRGPGRLLAGAGAWRNAPLLLDARADALDLSAVAHVLRLRSSLDGTADLRLKLRGTLSNPRGEASLRGGDVGIGAMRFTSIAADASYVGTNLEASVALADATGGSGDASARWQVDLVEEPGALAKAPLDLRLRTARLDLEFLEELLPDFRQVAGKLDAELTATGPLPLPLLDGFVSLREGRLSYTGLGDIREIEAELELSPKALRLRRLQAQATGWLHAEGAATRESESDPFDLSLEVQTDGFALVASDLPRGYLDSALRLQGRLQRDGLEGELLVSRALVELPDTPSKNIQDLEPHPDFVVTERGRVVVGARRQPRERRPRSFPVRLDVRTGRPMELRGTDVSIDATADLRAMLADEGLRLAGVIEVDEGYVVVMNRRFELEWGVVSYTGAEPPGDPRLDVQAAWESSDAKVEVTVGGTVSALQIDLRSTPPMSEAEIARLLATGRAQPRAGAAGASGASDAATALGAVLTSQLKRGIASRLPVDVIAFESGEESFEGSRLEAGTYLTDRIYVGYARRFASAETQATSDENENEVRIEYQLAPRWTLEMKYGDAHVGGADLFWTRDF